MGREVLQCRRLQGSSVKEIFTSIIELTNSQRGMSTGKVLKHPLVRDFAGQKLPAENAESEHRRNRCA